MDAVARLSASIRIEALRAWVCALLLIAVASAVIASDIVRRPNWGGDGYAYAIRMQMDRGIPYEKARAAARAFYADKEPMSNPRFRSYYDAPYPEWWTLFTPRVLYPWMASLIEPRFGMQALLIVSGAAYVVTILAVFALVLTYVPAEAALLITLCIAFVPEMRLLGRASLTDMPAYAFWTIALLAMVRSAKSRSARAWIVLYAAAAAAMTLTRPIAYVPMCAALGLVSWGWLRNDRGALRTGFWLAAIAAALFAAALIFEERAHAPSFTAVLQHLRIGSHLAVHGTLAVWYATRVAAVSAVTVAEFLATAAAPVAFFFIWLRRSDPAAAIFAGALASTILSILLNPIVSDVPRVIVLPMLPIVAAGFAAGVEAALKRAAALR